MKNLFGFVMALALVGCSAQVNKEVAYKGRLKVEQKLDLAVAKVTALEIRFSQKSAELAPFRAELEASLPRLVSQQTQFKKVSTVDAARATASNGTYLAVALDWEEPKFMNQYNGELKADLIFYFAGKAIAKARAIGTTKDDQTKVGNGRIMFNTTDKTDPVKTASARTVAFIAAFLEGKDSYAEGTLF